MTNGLQRATAWLQMVLRRLAELSIALLALLTLADVLGRYVFNISVIGAVELTEILMVVIIFVGIVMTTLAREHVAVDLLPLGFGPRGRQWHQAAIHLAATAISLLLATVTFSQAMKTLEYGDRTTILAIPLGPVAIFMSLMLYLNAAIHAMQLVTDLRRGPTVDTPSPEALDD